MPPPRGFMPSSQPEVRLVGTRVHGRVLVKASPATPAGILLGFHGYLESADTQLARLERMPGAEAWTLVSVQALNRMYRGRSRETVAGWMTRQDREEAIEDNIEYVNRVVADLGILPGDATVVCAGFSQGGAMAFRAGVRGAFGAAGIICVGADVPPELIADPAAAFPPVLFVRGARDEWLTPDTFELGVTALRARGADVQALVVDAAHEWTESASLAAGEFLTRITKR
jgi:predicted esterase